MSDEKKTYSVVLRVQRVTYEDAYVAVPISEELTEQKEDGSIGLNVEALLSQAIRISNDERVEWKRESFKTEPHPTQSPVPEDRIAFDAYYSDNDGN